MWLFFLILLGLLWISAIGYTDKLNISTDRNLVIWTLVPYFTMLAFPFFFPLQFTYALGVLAVYLLIGVIFFIDEMNKFNSK